MAATMDTRELRNVFGSFVTGVTVVTTVDRHGAYQGVTANSFSSVSLDPPLVLWSQATSAHSFPAFRDAQHFVVNILAEHQKDMSQRFARAGGGKFDGVATRLRMGGVPSLQECCAWVECRKVAMYPGGDHMVYLGEVLAMERSGRRPLAFHQGRYMLAYEHELNCTLEASNCAHVAHTDAVRIASAALPELAAGLGVMAGLGVWGNRGATIVRWESCPGGPAHGLRTGIVVSPVTSATGLLFSAYLPQEMTEGAVRETFAAMGADESPEVATARAAYAACRAEVRRAGLARSHPAGWGEATGFSAPVFDGSGLMVLALSAIRQHAVDNGECARIEEGLRAAACRLSARLGYRSADRLSAAAADTYK